MPDYVRAVYTSVKNTWQDAENLDDTHGYTSYIWIPEETFKVDVMKLRVYSEKFRAHSKAALAGGAQVVTSEATTIDHTHNVVIGTKTSVAGGAHSHSVTGVTSGPSSTSTTVAGGAHSHSVTGATSSYVTPSHTHDVAIGTKTSTQAGNHRHVMFSYVGAAGGYSAKKFYALDSGGISREVDLASAYETDLYTYQQTGAHTHDVAVGTVTSESGGGYHAHTVSGQTAVAVTDHSHGMEHTHEVSGQTAVAVTAHTHDVVIGTVTSAAGGGSHSHDVDLPDHTHPIDFGIYEEDIAGRTLSAILYDPDGNLVKDFGVVTTGEDNITIDLSEHFETLKYGFWRLVLTASARLRARLIFYELCKMYAQF